MKNKALEYKKVLFIMIFALLWIAVIYFFKWLSADEVLSPTSQKLLNQVQLYDPQHSKAAEEESTRPYRSCLKI